MASAFIVVFETWVDDKNGYEYVNTCAFRKKKEAETYIENVSMTLPDDTFDSYFIDEVGLF